MMKTIGMIGGVSWESTAEYYRLINQMVNERLGGVHSAKLLVHSVDFGEIEALQRAGDWDRIVAILAEAAQGLERSGADFLVVSSNTLHKRVDEVQAATSLPLVHIVDAVSEAMGAAGVKKVGLLATAYTMEQDFYIGRMEQHGFEVLVPDEQGRKIVHDVIFQELVRGKILDKSREAYKRVIADLVAHGAEGIILGCTEIPLLIKAEDVDVPVFDTTYIHAKKIVDVALGE